MDLRPSFEILAWDIGSTDHELEESASRQEMECLWKRTDTPANLRTDPTIRLHESQR